MTFSQLNKLIRLSRCQLLDADTNFVRRLERLADDTVLSAYENEKINKLSLDYQKQIRHFERFEA